MKYIILLLDRNTCEGKGNYLYYLIIVKDIKKTDPYFKIIITYN